MPDELIELVRLEDPTNAQRARLAVVKQEMAERVMASAAAHVYDPA